MLSFGPAKSHGVTAAAQTAKAQKPATERRLCRDCVHYGPTPAADEMGPRRRQRLDEAQRSVEPISTISSSSGPDIPQPARSRATGLEAGSPPLNPFTLHPRTAPPELEVFRNGGSSWLELQAVLNSKQDVRAQALFRAILGPNRKKLVSLQRGTGSTLQHPFTRPKKNSGVCRRQCPTVY